MPLTVSRRDFLRASTGGGFALGGLLSLGTDLRAAHAEVRSIKIANAVEVPSICPYCAVGCGQIVSVRKDAEGLRRIINIEGNPDSPVSRGTLCPKGAAAYQQAVNPLRLTTVLYRPKGGTEWEPKPLDWAMDRIAHLVKETRDRTFVEERDTDMDGNPLRDKSGKQVKKKVNHTLAIASLGGATMDNEWNYVQAKLLRTLGVVYLENQARI
jgi:formate dehydrogenase major subunit